MDITSKEELNLRVLEMDYIAQYLVTLKKDEKGILEMLDLDNQPEYITSKWDEYDDCYDYTYHPNIILDRIGNSEEEILSGFNHEYQYHSDLKRDKEEHDRLKEIFYQLINKQLKSVRYSIEKGKSKNYLSYILTDIMYDQDEETENMYNQAQQILDFYDESFNVINYDFKYEDEDEDYVLSIGLENKDKATIKSKSFNSFMRKIKIQKALAK